MTSSPSKFGQLLREKRMAMGYSLRKFAKLANVSPTYLSLVEQGNADPPTVERVTKMAELLDENVDEWISLAGRVPDDLPEIIQSQPVQMPELLREASGLTPEQLQKLTEQARRFNRNNKRST
ncbi:helix-turn-helix protein [Thalassoglobus neptunius]|uniref:Helix-turn-helix protein n=1 Tax=Thalassoglobus neptunius TaxID=1938619 RepID=A0A5C5VNE1_9PLAN|nr:helix-turn-helix transcriptional regulator [Thalassoglobus neptunius]TWT40196.1 helix-turn-helix protein [Thalassoglobus neptunius]